MTLAEFSLFLMSVLTSAIGQFLLKTGAEKLDKVNASNWLDQIFSIPKTPEIIAGLSCYGLGALAYILLLTRVNLSVAGPSVSLTYVFSVLMGYFFFKETIPVSRGVGLGLIICGVMLVIWKKSVSN
ncbi:EamA family transporter [Moorena bouillonii]|uniref:EamA-like transporter family protein n=1 Tax=Moorena bouillonii PNG TaxID=568701 RepID=A0A1U7N5D5_9CYAN|nr:EamA family transporter [Moorena bouillonii]OLT61158.1 EamA-like transporter family protein [Moorena bouillonii PNG]